MRKWIKQYEEGGIEGLARADAEIRDILPEGIDRTEEAYKKEILKLYQKELADCPNVKATDALKLSMRMMNGHKWEYFVMGLSFLGWILLSALTLGILSVFYVDPYMRSSFAEYYLELRDEALRTGAITQGQLDGTELV